MRILVIDDKEANRESAHQTLKGHDLTIVGSYDEAYKLLEKPRAEYKAVEAELLRRGFKAPQGNPTTEEEKALWKVRWEEEKRLEKELCPPPPFEVVLCDLLMPAGRTTMGTEGLKFVGQEMPVGFALSLMAVQQGAKYVAVVTATNHHLHPASAMIDRFASECSDGFDPKGIPPRFTVNGVRVGYYHAPMCIVGTDDGKDWGKVLENLTAP